MRSIDSEDTDPEELGGDSSEESMRSEASSHGLPLCAELDRECSMSSSERGQEDSASEMEPLLGPGQDRALDESAEALLG